MLFSPLRLLFWGNVERQDIREAVWQGGRTSEWQFDSVAMLWSCRAIFWHSSRVAEWQGAVRQVGIGAGGLGGSVAGLECHTLALWLPSHVRVWKKASGGVQLGRMTHRQDEKVEERHIFNQYEKKGNLHLVTS